MPNSSSKLWFLTANCSWEVASNNIDRFIKDYDVIKIIAYLHKGDIKQKEHLHFVCELKETTTQQTIKKWLRQVFDLPAESAGDKKVSASVWDGLAKGASSYMMHDDDGKPLRCIGYDEQYMEAMADANMEVQMRNKSKGKPSAESAKSHWDLMEIIWSELKCAQQRRIVQHPDGFIETIDYYPPRELWDKMIEVLNKNKVRLNEHEIERFFLTMYRQKDKLYTIRDKIFSKLGI